MVTTSENVVTIPLTNVANAQTINVTLNNVNGSTNVTIPMRLLIGDVNGDGLVNSGDAQQTRNRSGQATDATNFRSDVDADGFVSSGDLTAGARHRRVPDCRLRFAPDYSCARFPTRVTTALVVKLLRKWRLGAGALCGAFLLFAGCSKNTPEDEAKLAGLTTADLPQITADVFQPMDGGIALSPEEIKGRNAWNLWSGGNQHFWNHVAQDSFGLMDLLKIARQPQIQTRRAFQGHWA